MIIRNLIMFQIIASMMEKSRKCKNIVLFLFNKSYLFQYSYLFPKVIYIYLYIYLNLLDLKKNLEEEERETPKVVQNKKTEVQINL